jgi:glycosyltransferase involved in cell wall biosynthesis
METSEKISASVGILTFNSGETLRAALESIKDFDDVVICDGGSTDDTLEIAKEYDARVISQDAAFKYSNGRLKNFAGVRQQCLEAAKHDWYLYIDSDETISDGLREDIRRIVKAPLTKESHLVYRVPIGIMMDGRYLKYSSNYPGYQFRFFNRMSGAYYIRPIHERIMFDEKKILIGTVTHPWYIHTTREYWNNYIKENAYCQPIEIEFACKQPFSVYFQGTVLWHLRSSAAILIKSGRNYLLHGFQDAVPVSGEWGRAMVQFLHIFEVTRCKIKHLFTKKT